MVSNNRPRSAPALLGSIAALALLAVGCGAASAARDEVIAKTTNGTWACVDEQGAPNVSFVAEDGSFELSNTEDGNEGETADGSWKVTGKDFQVSLDTDDGDKALYDVRGFDDLRAEAGTITVSQERDGKAPVEYTFDLVVKGSKTIDIEPRDAKAFPSAPWTCTRQ